MSDAGRYIVSRALAADEKLSVPAGAWISIMAVSAGPYPVAVSLEGDAGAGTVYLAGPSRWQWPAGGALSCAVACYVTLASEAELLPDGGVGGVGVAAETSYTAAQSSTVNIPSAPTDGIALAGRRSVRATVSAPAAQTVTAGTVVWWNWSDALGRWAESPTQETPPTGRRDVSGSDQLVGAAGRVFAEWRSGTCSGAGSATITLTVA